MIESNSSLIAILLMAVVVYMTRAGGYLIGQQIRHIGRLRPVLEALPGCAMIAIIVPAVRQGTTMDLIALICVLAIMWKTDNVIAATIVGLLILISGDSALSLMQGQS